MTATVPIFATSIALTLSACLAASRRFYLPPTETLLASMHPLSHADQPFVETSMFADDEAFYAAFGLGDGLRLRRENARKIVKVLQNCAKSGEVDDAEVAFFSARAALIGYCWYGAFREGLLRRIAPGTPHATERMAAALYSEMQVRVHTLLQQYVSVSLEKLDAVL